MKQIATANNASDAMTKSLGHILHYRHFDYIMGYYVPNYADKNNNPQVHRLLSCEPTLYGIDKDNDLLCSSEQGGDVIPSR